MRKKLDLGNLVTFRNFSLSPPTFFLKKMYKKLNEIIIERMEKKY